MKKNKMRDYRFVLNVSTIVLTYAKNVDVFFDSRLNGSLQNAPLGNGIKFREL